MKTKFYDFLSLRYSTIFLLSLITVCIISILHFGEVIIAYREDYRCNNDFFKDNLLEKSYQKRLCSKMPIDLIYTWVNGSDPELLINLEKTRNSANFSHDELLDNCIQAKKCFITNGIVLKKNFKKELETTGIFKELFSRKIFALETNYNNLSFIIFKSSSDLQIFTYLKSNYFSDRFSEQLFFTTDLTLKNIYDNNQFYIIPSKTFTNETINMVYKDIKETNVLKISYDSDNEIVIVFTKKGSSPQQSLSSILLKPAFLLKAAFVWKDKRRKLLSESSENRFRDNEELKYSLRSVQKFAPWIRKIFLVTNGQIPSWLNIYHPRLELVAHKDIFKNHSHLPTFSSPAIESNLVNIPGLAERFIYLNDDFFFGKPIWPDDFESEEEVYKIYLTHPVPKCSGGCPNSWLGDGYCDKTCNKSECEFDAGDCLLNNAKLKESLRSNSLKSSSAKVFKEELQYCNDGCSDKWLADSYCDETCNVFNCGFDAGDCGLDNFDKIQKVVLNTSVLFYDFKGYNNLIFSYEKLYSKDFGIIEGSFSESKKVRTFVIAKKFHSLILVIRENSSNFIVNCSLKFKVHEQESLFNFSINLDTSFQKEVKSLPVLSHSVDQLKKNLNYQAFFDNYTELYPKVLNFTNFNLNISLNQESMPKAIKKGLKNLKFNFESGYLTNKGYLNEQYRLIESYLKKKNKDFSSAAIKYFVETSNAFPNAFPMKNKNMDSRKNINLNHASSKPYKSSSLGNTDGNIGDDKKGDYSMRKLKAFFHNDEDESKFQDVPSRSFIMKPTFNYSAGSFKNRHLMDSFSNSIKHVNRLYNRDYGIKDRKIPAHSAYYFNKFILEKLILKYQSEFDATSSHKLRSDEDMQLPFSYVYFVMSEQEKVPIEKIFQEFDVDESGGLSSREIRLLATRLYNIPFKSDDLESLSNEINNCKSNSNLLKEPRIENSLNDKIHKRFELTLEEVKECKNLKDKLIINFGNKSKYEHLKIEFTNDFVSFLMLGSNDTVVLSQLDSVRKKPTKFICLNDDIDEHSEVKEKIQFLIKDFYETLFPHRSQFELEHEFVPFKSIKEYRKYLLYKSNLYFGFKISLVFVFCLILKIHFKIEIMSLFSKFFRKFLSKRFYTF